jgi:outer membrane protein assembly factor BamE (lipoprotein component of BamABCDE complex)
MKHPILLLSVIINLLTLTSCNQIEKRGYSFELSDYQLLKEKINNKNDALNFMGYPSFISESDRKELWVYYSEDVKKLLFFKPEILDRKIITIAFDNKNVVEKIKSYDLKDQKPISFDKKYTHVDSTKKSWWSQIFGNIGQVKAN